MHSYVNSTPKSAINLQAKSTPKQKKKCKDAKMFFPKKGFCAKVEKHKKIKNLVSAELQQLNTVNKLTLNKVFCIYITVKSRTKTKKTME